MILELTKNILTSTMTALVLCAWPRIEFIMIEPSIYMLDITSFGQKEESRFIRSALCIILLIYSQSQFQKASLITT